MSILASLARAYERLPDAPPFGFAAQNIHFCIVLDASGNLIGQPFAWEFGKKGEPVPRTMNVPYFGGRSGSDAPPYFLWDNSAYVLGISRKEAFDAEKRFRRFRQYHLDKLQDSSDAGLTAVRSFIENWEPIRFEALEFPAQLYDRNIVFRLADERTFIHERAEAITLWAKIYAPDTIGAGICLITGEAAEIARLHPPLSGFENPARIVSFDKDNDAFSSYGHIQAENAPTGIQAAFAYSAVLNRYLKRDSGHFLQIADASTVFWADAEEANNARLAEAYFQEMFFYDDGPASLKIDEDTQAARVGAKLDQIRKGALLKEVEPELAEGVRFHVLGLAPNAARLSIRFYFEDTFGVLAENYRNYANDVRLETRVAPSRPITIWRLAQRTAPARRDRNGKWTFDKDRSSDLLCGELTRAVLTGANFPASLLSLLLMRVRGDHCLDYVRVALIKALLVRRMRKDSRLPKRPDGKFQEDYLVRTDPNDPNDARRLGRLFAVLERAQLAALGSEINTTVKDKFLGAAAATPARVFPGILKNAQNHLKRLRNGHSDATWIKDTQQARRVGAALDRDIGRLWASFESGMSEQHSNEEQGIFFIGYYQERFGGKPDSESGAVDMEPAIEQEKE